MDPKNWRLSISIFRVPLFLAPQEPLGNDPETPPERSKRTFGRPRGLSGCFQPSQDLIFEPPRPIFLLLFYYVQCFINCFYTFGSASKQYYISLFANLSCYCFCRCWHIMLKRIYYTIYFLSPSLCLSSLSLLPPPRRWGANSTHECAKHRTPSNTQHLGRRDARSVKSAAPCLSGVQGV